MLSYLSSKFSQESQSHAREPRAALFLNRFTRTATIMYATSGVYEVLGVQADQISGKSLYSFIQEDYLQESVECLESAKANDSIAYLRFRYRNPFQEALVAKFDNLGISESDEEDGGVAVSGSHSSVSMGRSAHSRPSTGGAHSVSSVPSFKGHDSSSEFISETTDTTPEAQQAIQLEAVISCTSDGLVMVLRKAHLPAAGGLSEASNVQHSDNTFASPWGIEPSMPETSQIPETTGRSFPAISPIETEVMATIRDVAVFTWPLSGINGWLAEFSRGTPGADTPPGDDTLPGDLYPRNPDTTSTEQVSDSAVGSLTGSDNESVWKVRINPGFLVRHSTC